MGEWEVEAWPFTSSGSFLAVTLSLSKARGRLEDEVEVDDERDATGRTAARAADSDGLAESSCLMAATRVLLSSSASSVSTDSSRLTASVGSSSTDSSLDDLRLRRPIPMTNAVSLVSLWAFGLGVSAGVKS